MGFTLLKFFWFMGITVSAVFCVATKNTPGVLGTLVAAILYHAETRGAPWDT